jgi:hypothetical protein
MQNRCKVCAERTIGSKSFWVQPMVLLQDVGQVEIHFGPFGDVLISTQDRYMVCAKRTIGSEVILDAPNCSPRQCGSSGSSFHSVWGLFKSRCKIGARFMMNVPQEWKSLWTT